ncbi:TPA: hypothetical protein J9755_000375 [Escherichia coli]|nr:hypothetical protein [Escherichia phage AV125]HBB2900526.1 hypothetical protein [Escherichia coli]HBC8515296.1 hypothetical protein [Escherichia coli]
MRQPSILEAHVQCVVDYVKEHSSLLNVTCAVQNDVGIVCVQHILSETRYEVFRATLFGCDRVHVNFLDSNYRYALENIDDYLPCSPTGYVMVTANEVTPSNSEREALLRKKIRQLKMLMEMQEEIEKELKEDFGMLPKDALKWYDELGGESNV